MKPGNGTSEQILSSNFLIAIIIFKCVCFVVGILGNLAVIIYNVFLNYDKTPTSALVVNLAVTDVVACLTIYPIWIAEFTQIVTKVRGDEELFCKISNSTGTVGVILSINTLLAITLDRYLFLSRPLKYPTIMTWPRTYLLIGVIWLAGLAYLAPLVLYTEVGVIRARCRPSIAVFLVCAAIFVYPPISIIVVLNYKMFSLARDQRRKIAMNSVSVNSGDPVPCGINETRRRLARALKTVKTFSIVVGVFLICLTPFTTVATVDLVFCNSCVPNALFIISGDFVGINSIMNPFIYGIRQKEYRIVYRRLFLAVCNSWSS